MKKALVRLLIFFGIVAVLAGIAATFAIYSFSSLPAPAPLPSPNGYDDLVNIGTSISRSFRTYKTMTPTELRASLRTNAALIAQGHAALKLDCRVPLQWPPTTNSVDAAMAPINLSEAFAAEGTLAEMEGRPQDALQSYLDIVRLGSQSCRGGLLADGMRGIAIEARGAECLQKLSVILDAKSCAQIVDALETADSQRESVGDYVRQEKIVYHQAHPGTKDTLNWYYIRLFFISTDVKNRTAASKTYARLQSAMRHEMVGIALRAYEADKGTRPKDIGDLIPGYLKAVPFDPESRTNITL